GEARVRLAHPLQARSEVRRLANDAALLRLPRPGEIANTHQPRRKSDTGLKGNARPERAHRCDQFEPRPYGPLRVVLMGLRITKVHEDAIPHISGDEPAEVVHGLGDAFLIDRNDLSQVLRVHAGGKRGGTTRSANITVTWRRSAVSWVFGSVTATGIEEGASGAAVRAAIAFTSFLRWPSDATPMSLRSSFVSRPSSSPSMSLARKISAYWARPIPRSQPSISKFSPHLGSCQRQFSKMVE